VGIDFVLHIASGMVRGGVLLLATDAVISQRFEQLVILSESTN
jgi:hypothetical protein